jgi:NADH-quinone oxidoreductase subunit J
MTTALFYVFAVIAVASAVLVILFRNPVYSALSLVTTFFCLAGLFVLLDAYFLSVVMVIVYAGAIMVLFLFVIMLLNLGHGEMMDGAVGRVRWVFVLALAGGLLAQVGARQAWFSGPGSQTNAALQTRNTETIGALLFTEYLFPFEIASVILTVALVGVVVLVKHEKK